MNNSLKKVTFQKYIEENITEVSFLWFDCNEYIPRTLPPTREGGMVVFVTGVLFASKMM